MSVSRRGSRDAMAAVVGISLSALIGYLVYTHLTKKTKRVSNCGKVSLVSIDKIETLMSLKTPMCMYVGATADNGDPGVIHASPGHPGQTGVIEAAYCKAAQNSSVACYAIYDDAAVKYVGKLPAIMRMTPDGQIHKYQGVVVQPGLDTGLATFMA